ncbi:YdaS family helix-turn-helix protein [Rhodanobacter sp. Si-c]|uniref:YdaS family helix-turn-helix protein n=1 Tax=Rhodanobacter lycopersici TaxID=3162487 RepID=A0ABV3QIE4_9GAMM
MPTAAIQLGAQPVRPAIAGDFRAGNLVDDDDSALLVEHPPGTNVPAAPMTVAPQTPSVVADLHGLPARMQLLIHVAGSAAALAKRCGFSGGAVHSWCHGRSDISRERCVIIARTLGISLRWLVTGEGCMRDESGPALHASTAQAAAHPPADDDDPSGDAGTHATTVDPDLLAAALRVLQSYIVLVGGSLNPLQRADAAAQIYQALASAGGTDHADRLVALHSTLGGYFCSRRSLIG